LLIADFSTIQRRKKEGVPKIRCSHSFSQTRMTQLKTAKRKKEIEVIALLTLNLELCSVLSKKCGLKNIFSKPRNLFSPVAKEVNASRRKKNPSRKI